VRDTPASTLGEEVVADGRLLGEDVRLIVVGPAASDTDAQPGEGR
jgi:hypothetical protein